MSQAQPPLRWTTSLPTKNGWYWYRYSQHDKPLIQVMSKHVEVLYIRMHLLWWRSRKGEWAGPIPEPEENIDEHSEPTE